MKKIVIRLEIHNDKCRKKALKTAAEAQGVISVSLEGDQLVVIGDHRVDSVRLTNILRKKFLYAILLSLEDLNVNVEAVAEQEVEMKPTEDLPICYYNHYYRPSPCPQVLVYDPYPNTCSIL